MPTAQNVWVALIAAGASAFAAIAAAVIAGVFAWKTRRAEVEAERARDLENRISERKYEIYKPMIELLRDMLGGDTPTGKRADESTKKIADFSTWIGIYGSDESVGSFHNLMQAIYSEPPVAVFMRLYGDFLVAARRDIAHPDTSVDKRHLLGMRIRDIYTYPDVVDPSFEEVCKRLSWQPPWLSGDVVPLREYKIRKSRV
ncbi:hypothetical protein [Lentzea sp. NPDC051838]|uniref:hypothetical protein n=1 Tax=Lentzea sp. NPDC051838 TaxID=3154849 RepID=UPI003416993E